MRIILIILIILVIGGLFISHQLNTNFRDIKSVWHFSVIFGKWVWQLGLNIKDILVYASHLSWLPKIPNITENISVPANFENLSVNFTI
jgi:hypothetical protein